jgi:hypothetical protein
MQNAHVVPPLKLRHMYSSARPPKLNASETRPCPVYTSGLRKLLHCQTFKTRSSLASIRGETTMATPAPSCNWPGVIILDQDAVGWRAFLEGGVLHAWAPKQQEYYNWIKRRNTGKRWITTLIKKLWEISWNMWEQRNEEVNNPESPASLREHVWLDALITTNYEDVSTLAIKDRRWFHRLKEVIFTESLEYKQQWLESVRLARI